MHWIGLFQIQLELDLARIRNPNPAGSVFGGNMVVDQRTICQMKLMASTMLSADIKRHYSSLLPLSSHCLPAFDKICGTAMDFVFLLSQ